HFVQGPWHMIRNDFAARGAHDDMFFSIQETLYRFYFRFRGETHPRLQHMRIKSIQVRGLIDETDAVSDAFGRMIRIIGPGRLCKQTLGVFENLDASYSRTHPFDKLEHDFPHTVVLRALTFASL